MRQHGQLAAVVSFMLNHVNRRSGAGRLEFAPTVAEEPVDTSVRSAQSFHAHLRGTLSALVEGCAGLRRHRAGAVLAGMELELGRGKSQPLQADVKYLSEDSRNGAPIEDGRLCIPGAGSQMIQDHLVYPFIDGIDLKQYVSKIGGATSCEGHEFASENSMATTPFLWIIVRLHVSSIVVQRLTFHQV